MKATSKIPFHSIREASELVGEPLHVLRLWERNIPALRPARRAGGRRYYRETDIRLLKTIQQMVRKEGLTLHGVNRILGDRGEDSLLRIAGDEMQTESTKRTEELLRAAASLRACARHLRGLASEPQVQSGQRL